MHFDEPFFFESREEAKRIVEELGIEKAFLKLQEMAEEIQIPLNILKKSNFIKI